MSADNKISTHLKCKKTFRSIQNFLYQNAISLVTFNLPEDRSLKVVLQGIPLNLTEDEIKTNLENHGLTIKLVKRFETINKPLPLCLVIFKKEKVATKIYEIQDMFYIKIKIASYRKNGPSQCYACQLFGHGSSNCGHPQRCVKCSRLHRAKDCEIDTRTRTDLLQLRRKTSSEL